VRDGDSPILTMQTSPTASAPSLLLLASPSLSSRGRPAVRRRSGLSNTGACFRSRPPLTRRRLSVRGQTDRFIPFAPDFLGTVVAAYSVTLAPASVRQQRTGSNFLRALRANGGSCAYVPTTSV